VNPAGIRVLNVRLNDLTYAPEIAQAMLMRQQALAMQRPPRKGCPMGR
jgi:hypothetical protein